jgi:hypothetical protein
MKGDYNMKKIKYVHVVKLDSYRKYIALYEDETWEELFQVRYLNATQIDGKLFLRKTRTEAIDIYNQLTNKKVEP